MVGQVGGVVAVMRPTAIKGDAAVAHYDALMTTSVAGRQGRLADYYLSTDEPPGVWWVQAASTLGLSGESRREGFEL